MLTACSAAVMAALVLGVTSWVLWLSILHPTTSKELLIACTYLARLTDWHSVIDNSHAYSVTAG
jgi:hypothetical protein